MKTLILSTIAAAAIALSAGPALANNNTDNGFAVYLQSQHQAPAHRSFLSGSDYADPDQGLSSNGKEAREFYKTQAQTPAAGAARSFLSGSDAIDPDQGLSSNGKDAREFYKTQGQGRW
jgi:fructose-specific component phosphotransferase system IIB-like protein